MAENQVKRIADMLEKLGIGSMLVGFYQGNWYAVLLGIIAICACLWIGRR